MGENPGRNPSVSVWGSAALPASWLLAGDKTEWLSPAGLRSQVQIQSSHQGPGTSGESEPAHLGYPRSVNTCLIV